MIYRINIQMAFTDPAPLRDLYELARRCCPHSVVVNPGTPEQERGFIETHRCYHDERLDAACIPDRYHDCPPIPPPTDEVSPG